MKNNVNSKRRSKRSRARKRRFVAIVAVAVILLALGALARFAFAPKASPLHATLVRSAPTPQAWTQSQTARLRQAVADALAPAIGDGATYSFVVLDSEGRVLYDGGADRAVTPASVQKLIVAFTSLELLGPNYRFHTLLAANHPVGSDGAIDGDIMLVGSGDPSLRSDDLRRGVDDLVRAGLRTINGGVRVDASAMRGPEINPHWDPSDSGEDYQTATSGISLDGDTAEFRIYGRSPGQPARVAVVPLSHSLHVSGAVTTSSYNDDVIIAPQGDPNDFQLSGTIPAQAEEKFWLPVHDIPYYAGSVLYSLFREAGVALSAQPTLGGAPLDAIALWDHRSAPVRTLVGHMLYFSDNHYAEQLLRTLGAEEGAAADDASGLAVETMFLHSRGIPTPGLRIVDGSGLADANRVSSITLARILADAETGERVDLYGLLPQGGRDGTLKHYDFTQALGRVRAKTGHLSVASSLAGYVNTMHHGRLVFALMVNDSPGDPDAAYVRAVDRMATF